jgi:hypothetical protein
MAMLAFMATFAHLGLGQHGRLRLVTSEPEGDPFRLAGEVADDDLLRQLAFLRPGK